MVRMIRENMSTIDRILKSIWIIFQTGQLYDRRDALTFHFGWMPVPKDAVLDILKYMLHKLNYFNINIRFLRMT